jgi:hypothetical protein
MIGSAPCLTAAAKRPDENAKKVDEISQTQNSSMCYKESGGQNRGGWLTVKVESALEAILLTVHGFARYERLASSRTSGRSMCATAALISTVNPRVLAVFLTFGFISSLSLKRKEN